MSHTFCDQPDISDLEIRTCPNSALFKDTAAASTETGEKKYGASKVASKYQQMICLSTQKHDASVQIESKYLANGHEILELLELSTILQRS